MYTKTNNTKYHGNHPIPTKKINMQPENNAIINNVVDDIVVYKTQKLSAAREVP